MNGNEGGLCARAEEEVGLRGLGVKEGGKYDAFSKRTEKRRQDDCPSRLPGRG